MKSRDDKPPRAWNSTIAARSKPMNRGPGPKRSARLASEIAPSRKPVRRKKRTASEYARIYGSRERVRFVKALGCVYCAAISPLFAICRAGESENAHTVTGGMGRKADYDTIVPLCPSHHKMFDQHRGPLADEAARDAIKAVAPAIEQLWQAECAHRGLTTP